MMKAVLAWLKASHAKKTRVREGLGFWGRFSVYKAYIYIYTHIQLVAQWGANPKDSLGLSSLKVQASQCQGRAAGTWSEHIQKGRQGTAGQGSFAVSGLRLNLGHCLPAVSWVLPSYY